MGFNFKDFSNWGNISGEAVVQSGPSAKNTDGDSYSTQTGNSTSKQWGNKNSFQHGVSNSVLLGMSFSTNVAGTFSTTAGFSFSTTIGAACSMQAALSVAGFIGPKFSVNKSWELSASWAEKYVWVKSENEYVKKEGKYELVNKDEKFATDANKWLGTENVVAKEEIRKVLAGDMSYATLTTKVAGEYNTKAAAVTLKGDGQLTMSTMGQMTLEAAAGITMDSLRVQINGKLVILG
jgi:hypothetical protein